MHRIVSMDAIPHTCSCVTRLSGMASAIDFHCAHMSIFSLLVEVVISKVRPHLTMLAENRQPFIQATKPSAPSV